MKVPTRLTFFGLWIGGALILWVMMAAPLPTTDTPKIEAAPASRAVSTARPTIPSFANRENPDAQRLYENALSEYKSDKDAAKARRRMFEVLEIDPGAAMPYYQLALLSELDRKWEQALVYFEQYLIIDPSSVLADKVRQELTFLNWAILYEQTLAGKLTREAQDAAAAAKKALDAQEWQRALEETYIGLRADPNNIDLVIQCGALQMKLQKYALAEATLQHALLLQGENKRSIVQDALTLCRKERSIAENKSKADKLFAAGKRKEAAEHYLLVWNSAPERTGPLIAALQCYVLTNEYSKAQGILKQAAATSASSELPKELKDISGLLARLDILRGSNVSIRSAKTQRNDNRQRSGSKPKTMAQDFLSRIKK